MANDIRVASALAQVEITEAAQSRVASVVVQVEYAEVIGTPVSIMVDGLLRVTRAVTLLADTRQVVTRGYSGDADSRLIVSREYSADSDTSIVIFRPISLDADVRLAISDIMSFTFDTLLVIRTAEHDSPTRREEPGLDFLGKGLRFPFAFQRRSGGAQISTATSSNHAHIHESIRQILGTRKGERLMRPDFGTRLHELVFEPNDSLLYGLLRHEVIEALEEWEPRVIITDVSCAADGADGHMVLVRIDYRLISSQVEGNLVYPFYRELE